MKRDPILAAIEEYKHTWQRLETLRKEIGEFERAHPGVTDCPRLVAMYGRETLLHEEVMEAAAAFATTAPTTPAGVIAAVQFVCERYEAGFLERATPGKPEEPEADRLRWAGRAELVLLKRRSRKGTAFPTASSMND